MSGTTIPAVWAALTNTWTAALTDVTVRRGPFYGDVPERFLAVGWDRTDQPSIQFVKTPEGLGDRGIGGAASRRREQEQYEISSLLSSAVDDNTIDAVIATLFAAYEVCAAALDADPTLGGLVLTSHINTGDVTPILIEEGALLDLRFSTSITALK